jgi:ribosome-binding factor A
VSKKNKQPSQRQLRVGELVRHALAEFFICEEIADADLSGVVLSVSEVAVGPDMKNATALVSALGKDDELHTIAEALNRHKKFIRGAITPKISLKYMPQLRFQPDMTIEQSRRIDEILHSPKVARDLET